MCLVLIYRPIVQSFDLLWFAICYTKSRACMSQYISTFNVAKKFLALRHAWRKKNKWIKEKNSGKLWKLSKSLSSLKRRTVFNIMVILDTSWKAADVLKRWKETIRQSTSWAIISLPVFSFAFGGNKYHKVCTFPWNSLSVITVYLYHCCYMTLSSLMFHKNSSDYCYSFSLLKLFPLINYSTDHSSLQLRL